MANNETKLTSLKALKDLARRVDKVFAKKTDVEELSGRVDDVVSAGGEPNVITGVKVNGTALEVAGKAVDIAVPTKASELANDANYQTGDEVSTAIGGLRTELMGEGVPEAYDTFKELADYIEAHKEVSEALTAAIGDKVGKEDGKGLSSNDFTDEAKAKLDGIEFATDEEVAAALAEIYGDETDDSGDEV